MVKMVCFYVFAGADGKDGVFMCVQVLMVKMVCFYVCAGADGGRGDAPVAKRDRAK